MRTPQCNRRPGSMVAYPTNAVKFYRHHSNQGGRVSAPHIEMHHRWAARTHPAAATRTMSRNAGPPRAVKASAHRIRAAAAREGARL